MAHLYTQLRKLRLNAQARIETRRASLEMDFEIATEAVRAAEHERSDQGAKDERP